MKTNIVGLDKPLLLLALYNAAKNQGHIYANTPGARFVGLRMKDGSLKQAKELFERRGHDARSWSFDTVDLGSGPRPLKVNLGIWEPDFSTYELHHGIGLADRIIESCRQKTIKELRTSMTDNVICFMENGQEKKRFEKIYTLLQNKKSSQTFFNEEKQSTPQKIDFGMPRLFNSKL